MAPTWRCSATSLGSLAVIAAAVLILITGWTPFDAIASLVIVVVIIPRAWLLLREVVDVLLEATPHGVDLAEVREHIKGYAGWSMSTTCTPGPSPAAYLCCPRMSSWTTPASTRAAPVRCWTGSANAWVGTSTSLTAPSSSSRLATKNTRPPTTHDAAARFNPRLLRNPPRPVVRP